MELQASEKRDATERHSLRQHQLKERQHHILNERMKNTHELRHMQHDQSRYEYDIDAFRKQEEDYTHEI